MSERDSDALGWAPGQHAKRQEVSRYETCMIGARPERPLSASGGIIMKPSGNALGRPERGPQAQVRAVVDPRSHEGLSFDERRRIGRAGVSQK